MHGIKAFIAVFHETLVESGMAQSVNVTYFDVGSVYLLGLFCDKKVNF